MTAALIIWAAGVLLAWPTLTAYGHPYHDWADAVTVTAIAFVAALLWPVLAIVGLYDLATLPPAAAAAATTASHATASTSTTCPPRRADDRAAHRPRLDTRRPHPQPRADATVSADQAQHPRPLLVPTTRPPPPDRRDALDPDQPALRFTKETR